MASLTKDTPTTYTIVDPMGTRNEPKETESAGVITGGVAGYFTTHREEVAQELQERYPHMLVTRHETSHGGRATRRIWTMPELPYKRNVPNEGNKQSQREAEHRAPDAQGVTNGELPAE